MKIKMYRHTIKTIEWLPGGTDKLEFYDQGNWTSVWGRVPRKDQEIVLTEEKEIEVSNSCLRRKKNECISETNNS